MTNYCPLNLPSFPRNALLHWLRPLPMFTRYRSSACHREVVSSSLRQAARAHNAIYLHMLTPSAGCNSRRVRNRLFILLTFKFGWTFSFGRSFLNLALVFVHTYTWKIMSYNTNVFRPESRGAPSPRRRYLIKVILNSVLGANTRVKVAIWQQ